MWSPTASKMTPTRLLLTVLMVLSGLLSPVAGAEDVGMCGGFVTASRNMAQLMTEELDYSKVEVHLYTTDGLLKHSSECSPNGYFFVPLYDKGNFYLQVEGPEGWAFEPSVHPFEVGDDGNGCKDDINFEFTGFSLTGKVVDSQNKDCGLPEAGPKGVELTLSSGDKVISRTLSGEDGSFSFPNIFPAQYTVEASHPTWTFKGPKSLDVTLGLENAQLDTPFVVNGYSVLGSIAASGLSISGVQVKLVNAGNDATPHALCQTVGQGKEGVEGVICSASTDARGEFSFAGLGCGEYVLKAMYEDQHTTFDIHPKSLPISVMHTDLVLGEAFKVNGFSVSGRVAKPDGTGVADAKVIVNGLEKAVTRADGTFTLGKMSGGKYIVTAAKDHMTFTSLRNQILSPSTSKLPDIMLSKLDICGRADSGDASSLKGRTVTLSGPEGLRMTSVTDSDGAFCFSVPPGRYVITPQITTSENSQGLFLSPPSREISLTDIPVLTALFTQARVSISGRLRCVEEPCELSGDTRVSLALKYTAQTSEVDPAGKPVNVPVAKDGSFIFKNVVPGPYKVSLIHDSWCFEDGGVKNLDVSFQPITDLVFQQTGYLLRCTLSQNMDIKIEHTSGDVRKRFQLTEGTNDFCVPKPGVYQIRAVDCFRLADEFYTYDTANPRPLALQATEYLVQGTISMPQSEGKAAWPSDLKVNVKSAGGAVEKLALTVSGSDDRTRMYQFWGKEGEVFTVSATLPASVSPSSKLGQILFYPRKQEVRILGNGCPPPLPPFEGRAAKYITGKVIPSVPDVEITVAAQNDELQLTVKTDSKGLYAVGPLHDDMEYAVTAKREGYHMVRTGDKDTYDFKALRLGNLKVIVSVLPKGEGKKQGLEGVLMSVSGEQSYRANAKTDEDGTLVFPELFPGTYFLRPLLKEYKFEPKSIQVKVGESDTVEKAFTATRVAYSVYGTVTSLNGQPEQSVILEAIGTNNKGKKPKRYEETMTERNGEYRLRGLYPGYTYDVQIKWSSSKGVEISRPLRHSLKVKEEDIENIDFIVFRSPDKFDITGTVNASDVWLSKIEVQLYEAGQEGSVLRSEKVSAHFPFFEFRGVPAGEYKVRCYAGASKRTHSIDAPEAPVDVRSGHGHVELSFHAEHKKLDDSQAASSVLSLLFGLLMFGGVIKFSELRAYVKDLTSKASNAVNGEGESDNSSGRRSSVLSKRNKKKRR